MMQWAVGVIALGAAWAGLLDGCTTIEVSKHSVSWKGTDDTVITLDLNRTHSIHLIEPYQSAILWQAQQEGLAISSSFT